MATCPPSLTQVKRLLSLKVHINIVDYKSILSVRSALSPKPTIDGTETRLLESLNYDSHRELVKSVPALTSANVQIHSPGEEDISAQKGKDIPVLQGSA